MNSDDTKILEFNQCQTSGKAPFIIYADIKCIIEKIDGCKINLENSSTAKVIKYIQSGFSMSAVSSLRNINKHEVYRSKDFIKKFCEFLIEHEMKVTNFKKKKMKLLLKENLIFKKNIENKYLKNKKIS